MEFVSPLKIVSDINYDKYKLDILLKYNDLSKLTPVEVDNSLNLQNKNLNLFAEYLEKGFSLIPIRRTSNFKLKSNFPARVLLEMTSRCNLECTMCPSRHLTRPKMDIDQDLFKKCVDELDAEGIDGLWIYNIGESILHPNFEELLKYVSSKKNLGPIWHSSNGQELTKKYIDLIIDSNVSFMNMSVNALSKETFQHHSPTGDFDGMIENFKNFMLEKQQRKQRFPFARVQIIDQEKAHDEIDGFLQEYSELADILSVNTLEAFSQNTEASIAHAAKRERPEKKSCHRVKRQDLFIFSNGETTFCDTDFNGTFSLGNVSEYTVSDIWNSQTRKNMIELNMQERLNEVPLCQDCLDYDL